MINAGLEPRGALRRIIAWGAVAAGLLACVPEGPATQGDPPPPPPTAAKQAKTALDPALGDTYRDAFERTELGGDWRALSPAWRIDDGALCGQGARNKGVWLKRRLPLNAVIEFDAVSASTEGDLKVEVWGDGRSGATKASYTDATSYLLIFGGWKNSQHVLARIDEHGHDRLVLDVDDGSDDPRQRPVEPGQVYRFRVERRDGRTIRWWVDDLLMHELEDAAPLTGAGHDHLAFNDWDVRVCFDNLSITRL